MKMKNAIPVSVLLAALLLAAIVLSGCPETPGPDTPEEKAKQLADATPEGNVATTLGSSLSKIENCTVDELIGAMRILYASQGMQDMPEPSDAERAMIEDMLNELKGCSPSVGKSVSETAANEYLVSYSFTTDASCSQNLPVSNTEDFLQIQVNVETGATDVITGKLEAGQKAQAEEMIQAMGLMGNCGGLMFFASTTGTVSSVNTS